jgi:hypothetical protein
MSLAWVLLNSSRAAQACAVCFGKSDNAGLIKGITLGIFVLLAFTFSMMGGIFMAVRRIEQDRAAAEARS